MRYALALLLLALPAAAADRKDAAERPAAPPLPKIELYCTDGQGERRELGEVICITASCQTWLARCEMSQNNVMWRKIQDGCPGAGLLDRLRRAS
ncbi:hypothetical protein [Tranquillimonas alkanivorans]|uniref:Kazal-type serine protease inhibitor domain-containing protein n=1 Tax=Tranquillimonas alkanivorans TaxID=441119 RepID=A0A1I5QM74_9RHOB|nr:hypothetical protein [Tranquillimonas alkanivorans]SFP47394.1 hypothetical protein SAMN04488047_10721 [Tranquillimonas alkanivorans]